MVELDLAKVKVRVRFPSVAPKWFIRIMVSVSGCLPEGRGSIPLWTAKKNGGIAKLGQTRLTVNQLPMGSAGSNPPPSTKNNIHILTI